MNVLRVNASLAGFRDVRVVKSQKHVEAYGELLPATEFRIGDLEDMNLDRVWVHPPKCIFEAHGPTSAPDINELRLHRKQATEDLEETGYQPLGTLTWGLLVCLESPSRLWLVARDDIPPKSPPSSA